MRDHYWDSDVFARLKTVGRELTDNKIWLLQGAEFPSVDLLVTPHIKKTISFPMYVCDPSDYIAIE
jgi:hypothetical protein